MTKRWVDTTPPVVSCTPTTNPSGKNVPPAGNNPKSGQNPDGFYLLTATDARGSRTRRSRSPTRRRASLPGPYESGTKIKLVQAPGGTPNIKPGPGDDRLAHHAQGRRRRHRDGLLRQQRDRQLQRPAPAEVETPAHRSTEGPRVAGPLAFDRRQASSDRCARSACSPSSRRTSRRPSPSRSSGTPRRPPASPSLAEPRPVEVRARGSGRASARSRRTGSRPGSGRSRARTRGSTRCRCPCRRCTVRDRLPALERPAARRRRPVSCSPAVHVVELQVPDREPKRVEPAEHPRERRGRVTVDDELPDVRPSVEAPVAHRQQPELRERHGTAATPRSPCWSVDFRGAGSGRIADSCGWSATMRSGSASRRSTGPPRSVAIGAAPRQATSIGVAAWE